MQLFSQQWGGPSAVHPLRTTGSKRERPTTWFTLQTGNIVDSFLWEEREEGLPPSPLGGNPLGPAQRACDGIEWCQAAPDRRRFLRRRFDFQKSTRNSSRSGPARWTAPCAQVTEPHFVRRPIEAGGPLWTRQRLGKQSRRKSTVATANRYAMAIEGFELAVSSTKANQQDSAGVEASGKGEEKKDHQ